MKTVLVFFAFVILFVSLSSSANAALINKTEKNIVINVLGAQDTNTLQNVTDSVENIISKVSVKLENNNLVLSYESDTKSEKEIDLNNFDGEIIEFKKEIESDSLYVVSKDNNVHLQQRGIIVSTSYPIEVDNRLENLTLLTNSGNRYLGVLPYDAVSTLLKADLIDEINSEGVIDLIELDAGELAYYVQGEKRHNLFDFFSLAADVQISVSALNGNVLSIDQPTWSRVLTFLKV